MQLRHVMENRVIPRGNGWAAMDSAQVASLYRSALLARECNACSSAYEFVDYHESLKRRTQAESFGGWVWELFGVYTSILEAMRPGCAWNAFSAHSMYHSPIADSRVITIDEDWQVIGLHFDPMIFDFAWRDNTMDHPWTPWGWEIDLRSQDRDDNHLFHDPEGKRLIYFDGESSRIEFHGFSPKISESLAWLKRVN